MDRTEYIQRLRADLVKKLNISREIIEAAFGAKSQAEFEKYALLEFDKFTDTVPFLKDRNNQANFSFGPLLLAAYRTMTKHYACTDVRAMEVVGQIMEHLGRYKIEHMNPALKLALSNAGKYSFLRKGLEGYFKYRQEPFGWQATILQEKDTYVAADMTACGLFKWLSLNHAPQLCSLACASDYITMENMPYLKLEREKTIFNGDSICSFRYIQRT